MNWQPQLKYVYHGNMMKQVLIDHILLNIMKKKTKQKITFVHVSYMTHYEQYLLNDSQQPKLICSNSMLPAINSPKISPNCPKFIQENLGESRRIQENLGESKRIQEIVSLEPIKDRDTRGSAQGRGGLNRALGAEKRSERPERR